MNSEILSSEFEDFKKSHEIFDICCYKPDGELDCGLRLTDDLPPLAEYGIDIAVYSDRRALRGDIAASNAALAGTVPNAPVIAPEPWSAESPELTIDRLIRNGAFAARVFPKHFKHSVEPWQMGRYFREMERRRLPLSIRHDELAFDALARLLGSYPSMPVILDCADSKTMYFARDIFGLMSAFPNLHLELHGFTQLGFLEQVIKLIGAERLLYGSNYPYSDPNVPLYMIMKSVAPQETQELILSGNAWRLAGGIL